MNLSSNQKKLLGGGIIALLVIAGIAYGTRKHWVPVPDNTTYHDVDFSFTYPRIFHLDEYAIDVATLGKPFGDTFTPLVEVVRYESDPDVTLPATYSDFIQKQAENLCGADGPRESITCTSAVAKPYTSPKGLVGKELTLTLVRKNLKTATTTSIDYGPFYVFNMTPQPTRETLARYSALFVYPSLAAFIDANSSPALLQQVVDSLVIPAGVSTIGR